MNTAGGASLVIEAEDQRKRVVLDLTPEDLTQFLDTLLGAMPLGLKGPARERLDLLARMIAAGAETGRDGGLTRAGNHLDRETSTLSDRKDP